METQEGVEVFKTDIDTYLHLFCEEQGIQDMKKESQSVWNGALRYIRRHVFSNKDVLKSKRNINICLTNDIISIILSTRRSLVGSLKSR